MNGRILLPIVLLLMGAYTSISFVVDSWEGRLCWDSSGTYVRLPLATALRGAVGALAARMDLLDLVVLTAFIWPIAALLLVKRSIVGLAAVLLTSLPFAFTVYSQVAIGVQDYCTKDSMAELGFAVAQLLVIPATILVLLVVGLFDRISVRFAVYRATRRFARAGRGRL